MSSSRPAVRVADVMTSRVRTAPPDASLAEIWEMLADERCHHVPVVDDGRIVGMISTRDLLRAAHRNGAKRVSDGGYSATAAELMTPEPETIHTSAPVEAAIDRIGEGDLHSLLVVDDAGQLAGIVTHRDLLHYLAS